MSFWDYAKWIIPPVGLTDEVIKKTGLSKGGIGGLASGALGAAKDMTGIGADYADPNKVYQDYSKILDSTAYNRPNADNSASDPRARLLRVADETGPNFAPQQTYQMSGPNQNDYRATRLDTMGMRPGIDITTGAAQSANQLGLTANQDRGAQLRSLSLQEAAARGEAPSAAQQQLLQGLQTTQQQALSSAASARGGIGAQALARKQAIAGNTVAGQDVNQQMAALRAQEMASARGAFQEGATALRGSDIGAQQAATGVGNLGLGMSAQQLQAAQQNAQLRSEQQNYLNQARMGAAQQNLAANIGQAQFGANLQANQYNTNAARQLQGLTGVAAIDEADRAAREEQERLKAQLLGTASGYASSYNQGLMQKQGATVGAAGSLLGTALA